MPEQNAMGTQLVQGIAAVVLAIIFLPTINCFMKCLIMEMDNRQAKAIDNDTESSIVETSP